MTTPDTPTPEVSPADQPSPPGANPEADAPAFGWNAYAERLNGRFAMVGFVALLVLELVTQQTFFAWLGF
ncbi:MAG: chlorophyll a/b-binding protein [Leptolyngbya sp.]|nr:chlorophyll a/b-binding protein [Leptolyngbya sp.]